MKYYRYMNFNRGVELLEKRRLRLSSVSWFNDPFDCYGITEGLMSDESCWYFVNRDLSRWRSFLVDQIGSVDSILSASASEIVDLIQTRMESCRGKESYLPAEVAKEWLIDQQYRLMCLSGAETYDDGRDILMWSHYADSCRGARVELEINNDDLPTGCRISPIDYCDVRPVLSLAKTTTWDSDDREYIRYVEECLWSKCSAWRYENEFRLVVDLSKISSNIGKDKDEEKGYVYHYWDIPPHCLKSIAFGFASNCDQVERLAYKYRHEKLPIERMTLSPCEYRVFYNPA